MNTEKYSGNDKIQRNIDGNDHHKEKKRNLKLEHRSNDSDDS